MPHWRLYSISEKDPWWRLKSLSAVERCKLNLVKKFQHLNEVMTNRRNPTLLNEIYTDLYITEGDSGKVNNEHEVRQIEAASRRAATAETPIKCSEIFKPLSEEDKPIRIVLTKGVAGIGKTVSVQKFILDWAEGKTNLDVLLIFPLPFRELNLMKNQKWSLVELLHFFLKEQKETNISRLDKVLFIFDGLDECRFSLDFRNTVRLCDVTEPASVDVLLINLIKGNLLPSALIWITSRPAAADQIPPECVGHRGEVRGFNDPQKEEYFRKRISDQSLSSRIITHLKSLRSLYIMCHIPVFCWISATVLERMLGEAESGEIPKTLTQMYTHFLIIQTNFIRKKYTKSQEADKEMLLKLGKLAFQQLMKGNLIFYEEDLMECGIDVKEASVYSGVCTQIFREEFSPHQSKVYCFVHLSIQEHLAALYVHLTFINEKKNVLKNNLFYKILMLFRKPKMSDVHKSAVDQALQSKNGHLDLFLRFLLGLSLESIQNLLQTIMTQTGSSSHNTQETVVYIKKKIRKNPSTEKSINLFHCLNELEDHSLVEEIQLYLQSGNLQKSKLSSSQWSAVVFVLLTSAQEQDVFDLNKYSSKHCTSEEVLLKLLPVVAASRKADCSNCDLKEKGCSALASVLSSESSSLRELDLSKNKLRDTEVKCLSAGLGNPHCNLEILSLCYCGVSDEGIAALTSALRSNPSHLRELDLTGNYLRDSGVERLSDVLENPQCKLEILRLYDCVSDEGCAALTSALRSNPSHLRELDLCKNKLGDSEVECLSAVLKNPHCKLEILRLCGCGVSDEGCAALTSALGSNPSHVKKLDLTGNTLGDKGVKCLSAVLENPHCKVETLRTLCIRSIRTPQSRISYTSPQAHLGLSQPKDCRGTRDGHRRSPPSLSCSREHRSAPVFPRELCSAPEFHGELRSGPGQVIWLRRGCRTAAWLQRGRRPALPQGLQEILTLLQDLQESTAPPQGLQSISVSSSPLQGVLVSSSLLQGFKESSVVLQDLPESSVPLQRPQPQVASRAGTTAYKLLEGVKAFLISAVGVTRPLDTTGDVFLRPVSTECITRSPISATDVAPLLTSVVGTPSVQVSAEGVAPFRVTRVDIVTFQSSVLDITPLQTSPVGVNPPLIATEGVTWSLVSAMKVAAWSLSYAGPISPPPLKTSFHLQPSPCLQSLQTVPLHARPPRLRRCDVSDEGFATLTSALRSNPSHLRELDLSENKLKDSAVQCLSAVLENPHCKLEILSLCRFYMSDEGIAALTSALRSNPSHLRELDMSGNKLRDSGVKHFSAVLENPQFNLEILRLCGCEISDEGCAALTSALRSNPSHLRELELTGNTLRDSGVKHLSAGLENPQCKLEILRLRNCGVSEAGCDALALALRSDPSHLRELDLTENELKSSGVKHLSAGLENPHCKLEKLRLCNCGVTDEGCVALASALKSNPSHLRELNLSGNKLKDSEKKLLSSLKDDKRYKLQILIEMLELLESDHRVFCHFPDQGPSPPDCSVWPSGSPVEIESWWFQPSSIYG
ncbi:NACHT, LRR and PYD domains-containing protein 12 isoform X3 [Silurus meridionalis]|nr:NACHT, LRR and PYD domains-containing protein 12 isoform X3 [Silurus meridionalis]